MSRRSAALLISLLMFSIDASAHGSSKSLGSFFGGFVHPLLEPAHLIALLALSLCLGQRGLASSGMSVPAFITGIVPGLVAAGFGWRPDTDVVLLGVATLAGVSVASAAPIPRSVLAAGCAVAGASIGLGSSPDLVTGGALWATLFGTGLGAIAWLSNGAALVQVAKRPWVKILVRVAGSWATASSVLVLALWIVGTHPVSKPDQVTNFIDLRR